MYSLTLARSQDGVPAQSGFSLQALRDIFCKPSRKDSLAVPMFRSYRFNDGNSAIGREALYSGCRTYCEKTVSNVCAITGIVGGFRVCLSVMDVDVGISRQRAEFFSNAPSSVTREPQRFTITGDNAKLYGRA